jgi:uncharacterized protein YjdB
VITLSPTTVTGAPGGAVQIAAAPQDANGKPLGADVVAWMSSDPSVASVSGSGVVTLKRRGTATVTAIADGVTASDGVEVSGPPVASVSVTPGNTLIQAGGSVQLVAVPLDATGAADSGGTIGWSSSNSGIASVSTNGLVQAIAVGTATITASVGGVSGTSTIKVTSSAPSVATVAVSPATSQLYPGRIEQLTATLRDSAGHVVSGFTVTWSSSSNGVASVSSTGVVTANAPGSTSITASAGGQSGSATVSVVTPVAASISISPTSVTLSPGQSQQLTAAPRDANGGLVSVPVTWSTSASGVASISSAGVVTANGTGTATITAKAGSVSATADVTVQSGPPGGYHEPSGMAMQINTGPLSGLPSNFSMFSPATPTSTGESSHNLIPVPDGSGVRLLYPPQLAGGNSPVRFGVPIASPGRGWYYQRMRVRFSTNWTLNGNVALKFCEPRTQQTGSGAGPNENHVIGAHDMATESIHAWYYVLLQGPNGHFRDLFEQPSQSPSANLADGKWHVIEALFTPESTPGAGNGGYDGWVDGFQVAHYTDVLWLAPGNQVGWPYLLFDPTYGGGSHSPPTTMYWDLDQLYVSTK